MTNLERVREGIEWLCDGVSFGRSAGERDYEMWLDELDAHLKEDAERDKDYMNEIVRLRDNLYQAQRQVKVSEDD